MSWVSAALTFGLVGTLVVLLLVRGGAPEPVVFLGVASLRLGITVIALAFLYRFRVPLSRLLMLPPEEERHAGVVRVYNRVVGEAFTLVVVVALAVLSTRLVGHEEMSDEILAASGRTLLLFLASLCGYTVYRWADRALLGPRPSREAAGLATVVRGWIDRLVMGVLGLAFFIGSLHVWGVNMSFVAALLQSDPVVEVVRAIASSVLIVVVTVLLVGLTGRLIDRLIEVPADPLTASYLHRRGATLGPMLQSTVRYLGFFVALLMVLRELGVDATPIIAGAGIVGLAVGFGAQSLVKDVVTGFFIIFEDHFNVGDFIQAAGVMGTVEEVGLRVTRLRDPAGMLHIIPNGSIHQVTSFSKGFCNALIDFSVSYAVDVDKAISVLEEVGRDLAREIDGVLQPTNVIGVSDLGDFAVQIRTITRCRVGRDSQVGCELRRRVKRAFDGAGIEIPYPHRVVIHRREGPEEGPADGPD